MKFIKKLKKEKQILFIVLILAIWACVIFFKYGGQSLLIHYLWPFIVAGSAILLFKKNWLRNKVNRLHIFGILAIFAYLVTFIFDLSSSDGSLELMNITFGILLAFLLSNVKWNDKTFKWLFAAIIIIVCLIDLWGIINYAGGHPFNRLVGPLIKPNEAFSGFPNLAANLNLLALLPAFYFFINAHYKSRLISFGVILANMVIVTSLFLTYSRAAWFAAIFILALSIIFLGIKFGKNRRIIIKYLLHAVFILFFSIALFIGINNVRSYSQSIVDTGEKISFQSEDQTSSITERIASIKRSINMTIENPLTGVGSGSYNFISQSYEQNFNTLSSYPYSLPFKILAENGMIAFSLILVWIVGLLFLALKRSKNYKLIAVLTVITLFVHHSMDNNFNFFAASLPTFLILGMVWPDAQGKSVFKNIWVLILICIFSVSGIFFVIHEGYYGLDYIRGRNAAGAGNHELAVKRYENSLGMFYNRDARLAAAKSNLELYKSFDQNIHLVSAENHATKYMLNNHNLDKRGALIIAETQIEQNNYSKCLDFVNMAENIGGSNNLEIDYYKLICTKNLYQKQNLINELIPKLKKYYELLKVNAHMTVLTDNPKYAVKILDLISDRNPEYLAFYYEMLDLAVIETMKFHNKYGIDAEIRF